MGDPQLCGAAAAPGAERLRPAGDPSHPDLPAATLPRQLQQGSLRADARMLQQQ